MRARGSFRGRAPAIIAAAPDLIVLWNSADKSATFTLSEFDLRAKAGTGNTGVRATLGRTTGKHMFSMVAHSDHDNYYDGIGVCKSTQALDSVYAGTGGILIAKNAAMVRNGDIIVAGYLSGGTNHVYDFAVDLGAKLAWGRMDGNIWNNNAAANPATGVGGIDIAYLGGVELKPVMASATVLIDGTANFGASPFTHALPAGYNPWSVD